MESSAYSCKQRSFLMIWNATLGKTVEIQGIYKSKREQKHKCNMSTKRLHLLVNTDLCAAIHVPSWALLNFDITKSYGIKMQFAFVIYLFALPI